MKKKYIWIVVVFVILSAAVLADANVRFTIPSPIVKDVPFDVAVEMNSNNADVARIQFYTTSQSQQVNFLSASQGSWLPNSIVQKNEALSNGKTWWYNIGPTAPNFDSSTDFKNVVTLRAKTQVDDTLMLTANDNLVALYPNGEATINSVAQPITTSLSFCGDGVVGYVDGNVAGVKDGNDVNEACDSALPGGDGCSSDCSYIKATHKITGTRNLAAQHSCEFGSRSCALTPLDEKDKLLAKLNAIFDLPENVGASNPSCFPYAGHPQAESSFTGDRNGAFCIIREGPAQQFTPFLNALLEYYRAKGYIS